MKLVSACLLYQGGCILMARSKKNGRHILPAGKVEEGESVQEAALRELFEETGLVGKEAILCCAVVTPKVVVFFHRVNIWDGDVRDMEPHKHTMWEWLPKIPDTSLDTIILYRDTLDKLVVAKG